MEKAPDNGLNDDEGFTPWYAAGEEECGEGVEDDD
jgi:hypothetical protein